MARGVCGGVVAVALLWLVACDEPAPSDAGAGDAALADGGGDAAAYQPPDAGPPGAAVAPTVACDAVAAGLYATPSDLPPFTAEVRGELLGCATLETIDAATLAARLPDDAVVLGGVRLYLVAFRTATAADVGAISTALVILPDVALSDTVPLAVAMHGSVGLADDCAPSRLREDPPPAWLRASYLDALLLAWAARGVPTIAPDYPGLGTDGVHAYASWIEPARSGIDAARALRSMLPADRLAGDTLVYGHSQGGGLALGVAAVASEAPDVELSAVVAMAPAYRILSLVEALRLPTFPVDRVLRAASAFALYAELSQITDDPARRAAAFPEALRAPITDVVERQCYGDAVLALDAPAPGYEPPGTVGALVDEAFRLAAVACADGGDCSGDVGAFVARDAANEPHLGPDAPPVLALGSNDDEALPAAYLGCAVERSRGDGATVDSCMQTGPDHLGVVETGASFAIAWALAARGGDPRPPCAGTTRVARCPF